MPGTVETEGVVQERLRAA